MPPNVSANVDEISSHENQDVVLSLLADASDGQASEYSDERHAIDEAVAEHCLNARKAIFHQDADIAHLTRDFMCESRDNEGNDGASIFGSEGDADSETIKEIMNENFL